MTQIYPFCKKPFKDILHHYKYFHDISSDGEFNEKLRELKRQSNRKLFDAKPDEKS